VVDGYFWPLSWLKLGVLQHQAVNVARAGLTRSITAPAAPPTMLAAAQPAVAQPAVIKAAVARPAIARTAAAKSADAKPDAYLAVRTAYQETLLAGAPAKPVPPPRPAPAAPITTIVAASPSPAPRPAPAAPITTVVASNP
jgi:hypothetical protein